MAKLILIRHGQSIWNKKNLFTGWVDIPLSTEGIEEALQAGEALKNESIDLIYTSTLIRAQMTVMLMMSRHHAGKSPVIFGDLDPEIKNWNTIYSPDTLKEIIPVIPAWQLNERMYGELQGMNKKELADKYGAAQIQIWRRSFDVPPPRGESLEMTAARTLPYFDATIVPELKKGKNILVCAHGNSLRSIMMELEGLSSDDVVRLELATGIPIVYTFENHQFTKMLA